MRYLFLFLLALFCSQLYGQNTDKDRFIELKGSYVELKARLERLEAISQGLEETNQRLTRRIDNLEQEGEQLKTENETYKRAIRELTSRINRSESAPYTYPSRSTNLNLGSMSVTGGQKPAQSSSSHYYIRGPRGGCYYITASGRKQYVDRSLCN